MYDDWGISDGYFDVAGDWHETSTITRDRLRAAMGTPEPGPPMWFVPVGDTHSLWDPCRLVLEDGTDLGEINSLPDDLPIGYHRLHPLDDSPITHLVVHPATCPPVPSMWGVAAQLYALWSPSSWGIGDLADLATLALSLRAAGGEAILSSPLHQPAPPNPQEHSPYYPSSRRAWNPMLIALADPPPANMRCEPSELINRDAVWTAKRAALEELCARSTSPTPLPTSIALWNALCDEFGPEWQQWPPDLRRFDLAVLADRLRDNREFAQRAGFHQWCQDIIGEQLATVRANTSALIGDLAVGFAPNGSDAWEFQDVLALDVRIGAPPDPFNALGQEWGLPAFIPWRLRNARYEPFIATLRAAFRSVDGLRIDHVMGLFRQYWVPAGMPAAEGAYVVFPSDELLAIVCLEATRARAFVVGEDLGTVAEGVRETLTARAIAGTRVLWFELDPPTRWPIETLATVTTHDLPTIAGVLGGTDGDTELLERLRAVTDSTEVNEVIAHIHAALIASPSALRLISLDDACGVIERPNRPGTVGGSNWRRRLPVSVDAITFRAAPEGEHD